MCKNIYFPTEAVSADQIVIFNGLLSLLVRSAGSDPPFADQEGENYGRLCEKNFLAGVQTYEVMVSPSRDHVFALYLAVYYL